MKEADYPKPGSRGYPALSHDEMTVTIVRDDTLTVAQLVLKESQQVVASGVSKRHPRDARNPDIGKALAVGRMFASYAAQYERLAAQLSDPGPEPDAELVKAMRRANRAEAVKRKNERRRAARDAWFAKEKAAAPDSSALNDMDADEWRGRAFGDWGEQ